MVVFSPRPYFLPGIAAYHCQQAGEKLVKAVLIHRGIEPIRSHDIDMVIGGLPSTDGLRPILAPLGRFTPYAVAFRYPGEDADPGPPGREEVIDWIAEIDTVMGAVAAEIEAG